VLTAVLFGLAHAPNPLLMLGGAGIVFFYSLVWRKAPSLPAIAVSHGWIGAIADKALHVSMRVGAHYFTP
jgi:membrane protease YdiL (CAAX protease family)